MRAKFINEKSINEGINNILKPKSNNDIKTYLNNFSQEELNKMLIDASMQGKKDNVKVLLDNGVVDVNTSHGFGSWSELMFAAYNGHIDIVKMLLDNGADINAKYKDGRTALMLAAINYRKDVVKFLIKYNENEK